MKEEFLEKIGLTRNEAKVYLAVLRTGSASAGRVSEASGVHRRNVYDAAESLVKKGLAGYVLKNKVKYFKVTSPQKLLDMVREQREALGVQEKTLESLIPELLLFDDSRKEKQDVNILKGRESRKIVFEDILRNAKDNCCLGGHTPSKLSMNYVKHWHRRRVRAGTMDRIIYNKKDPFANYLKRLRCTEVRIMPKPIDSKTVINIYGSKVAIFLWIEDQPFTIWIDNEKVSNDFRSYFDFMWGKAMKY
jgi:sugar-specific transcriptional regulator TrmB